MLRINLDKPKVEINYSPGITEEEGWTLTKCCNVRTIMNYELPGNVYDIDDLYPICPKCTAINPEQKPERTGWYWFFNNVSKHGDWETFPVGEENNTMDWKERAWKAWVEKGRPKQIKL